MTDMEGLTKGITGILGAGIMLKAADTTLEMIGNANKKRRKRKSLWW